MKEQNQVAVIDNETLSNFLNMTGHGSLPQEKKGQFLEIAKAFNLNPFKREIHLVSFGTQFSIIIGYEAFIKRAESTGLLSGWKAWTEGSVEGNDLVAKIIIHRKDFEHPFEHEVYYEEFVQMKTDKDTQQKVPNENWGKRPRFMLKKVVIGQGFRMCFSTDLGGMPYTEEEGEIIAIETVQSQESKLSDNQKNAIEMLELNRDALKIDEKSFKKLHAGCMESEQKATDAIAWMNTKLEKDATV